MSDDELHALALALIQPQLNAWLRELTAERKTDAAEPSETERAA